MTEVRRIVCVDDADGRSKALSDGPCEDVRTDPARPGFSATRVWATWRTPAAIRSAVKWTKLAHMLEPPPGGSVFRVLTIPPDDVWRKRVGEREVRAWFGAMNSPAASQWSASAPHPYMQRTPTLDFCIVLEGAVTLVLDRDEVDLAKGDTVVQRATRHAWSNRSSEPCLIAISSHDARSA